MQKLFPTALFLTLVVGIVGCNAGPNQTNIEIVDNMMDQESIKSQDWDPHDGEKVQMRMPPEGTVSRGNAPYEFASDSAGGEKQRNPLNGDMSAETLTLGQKTYDVYCKVCHGSEGKGDGAVAEKMAVKPRNLLGADALAYSDGRIYHAITMGKGVMGSYQSQITDAKRRWAVVNYVRSLQKNVK
jgi:mono/diheme cytochrome c family protein